MPIVSTIKMTAHQFIELGEDPAGVRLELVDGEVAVSPSPIPDHSYVEKMLSIILGNHILQHDLGRLYGDVDTIFGPRDVRRPDIIYFQKSRQHLVGRKAMEGPPDVCVEILSPSSETIDKVDKFEQYEAAGVAHYWIVDPAGRTARAWRLVDGKYVAAGEGRDEQVVRFPPFDELDIPLGKIWHAPTR
ncbi:MAG: Uma2 family endonuclease [Phycisphaerae bacterium]|nr:Uma2 family endonuclease [Tepidisphaeraceae bacterium]